MANGWSESALNPISPDIRNMQPNFMFAQTFPQTGFDFRHAMMMGATPYFFQPTPNAHAPLQAGAPWRAFAPVKRSEPFQNDVP